MAVERALAKAYGPRRAAILGLKADLLLLKGDRTGAHSVLVEQLAGYTALPIGQKQDARESAVRQRLAEWR